MDTFEYIKSLSFKDSSKGLSHNNFKTREQITNTIVPIDSNINSKKIANLCKNVPKMSTYAIGLMINKIVSDMNPKNCFLNVGVWKGFTFFAGLFDNKDKTCIGVDNFSQFNENDETRSFFYNYFNKFSKNPSFNFYEMDYINYFEKKHKGKIGFYIYDGEHSYENQLKALQIAEPYFSDDCIILIDDTNTEHIYQANLDFISNSQLDYEILIDFKTPNNGHPTYWSGIMIFKRV